MPSLLNYSRQNLRKASKFVEADYRGINPRKFYRSLKRKLEEIREEGDFKYRTYGNQENALKIESEEIGEKTGRVEGRLAALSNPLLVGQGEIEFKSYKQAGIGMVLGIILLLLGLAHPITAVIGVIILFVSLYLYFQSEIGNIPIQKKEMIRILIEGEVSERTIEDGKETHTDMFANMSVIFAGDTFLIIAEDHVAEFNSKLQKAISDQAEEWYRQIKGERPSTSPQSIKKLSEIQDRIGTDLNLRKQYTEYLKNELPDKARTRVEKDQKSLLDELKNVSKDMDLYVEREGLKSMQK